MNDKPNCIHDVFGYVDGLQRERAKTKIRNSAMWLKEWSRRCLGEMSSTLWRLFKSDRLSGFGKVMFAGVFLYCMVSADIISDLLPVVGYLDDIVVVLAVMMYLNQRTSR